MKVLGIGLNRTGTTTLGVCLRHWGFNHRACDHAAFELWRTGRYDELLSVVRQYDSFEDWPWPLIYREIDEAFPGTKFILTRRKDPQTWFDSLCRHAERIGPTDYRESIYGHAMPHGHREEYIAFYERHNEAVRAYFRDRPDDFLEVCWEQGDGWDELSSFLGLQRPDLPFPHANQTPRTPVAVERLKDLARHFARRLFRSAP